MSGPLPTNEQINALKDLLQLMTHHGISFNCDDPYDGIEVVVDHRIYIKVNNLSDYIKTHKND